MLLLNKFQNSVIKNDSDGFYTVTRHNNPLRKHGLAHRDLGKVGPVVPERVIKLAGRLVGDGLPFHKPLIMGLSESSILLGRVICEYYGGGLFLFSTRYPRDESGMVPFTEIHSHAPSQFLQLSNLGDCREIVIVEDEITTGNTIINLIEVLAKNLPSLKRVALFALKALCASDRFTELSSRARAIGVDLSIRSLYQDSRYEESCQAHQPVLSSPSRELVSQAHFSEWERGRGRLEAFKIENAHLRRQRWEEALTGLSLPRSLTVIGASEAIDLAFEITGALSRRGHRTFFRHLTISPWEVPGWIFPAPEPGARPLHLYMPPHRARTYIIVYDQPFQREQVQRLSAYLQNNGSNTHILKGYDLC